VATVKEDQLFRVETIDWTGGQIKDDDSSEDVKRVDLTQVHYLSVGAIGCLCSMLPASAMSWASLSLHFFCHVVEFLFPLISGAHPLRG